MVYWSLNKLATICGQHLRFYLIYVHIYNFYNVQIFMWLLKKSLAVSNFFILYFSRFFVAKYVFCFHHQLELDFFLLTYLDGRVTQDFLNTLKPVWLAQVQVTRRCRRKLEARRMVSESFTTGVASRAMFLLGSCFSFSFFSSFWFSVITLFLSIRTFPFLL